MERSVKTVLPGVIEKMRLKNAEKISEKEVQNKMWKRLQKENFSKSLDSRSFVFTKIEKKVNNTKSF